MSSTRFPYRQRWSWTEGHRYLRQESIADVASASYALSTLADRGLLTTRQLADFQEATGLADFAWRTYWHKEAREEAGSLRDLMRRAQGFVIFLHGWDGSHAIWDPPPALVCAANPRLVALAPDVNGFGGSPFLAEIPLLEQCDPPALMQAIVHWVNLLRLRSDQRARQRRKVITFVGHSMSGAALFYLDEKEWAPHEVSRCAIAPALLINDILRKGFYKALGLGIWAGSQIGLLDRLKSRLAPSLIEQLIGKASEAVKAEHLRIFENTPKGTLAQTFFALGSIRQELLPRRWQHFRVILGHDDPLVGVSQMLYLLDDLGFASHQIQVVLGDHYLFSVSNQNRRQHLRNREIVVGTILHLHESCREQQSRLS